MNTPVKWFETSILAISAFNLFVVFATMLWSVRRIQPANRLLLVWLFVTGTALAMMFILDTGLIAHTPWLYRLPSPLYYLLFPAAYLYIRMMMGDQLRLKSRDLLHTIPALLHFVELLPFYLKPASYKLDVVLRSLDNPLGPFAHAEGLLSDFQHNILRGAIGLGYMFAIFRLFYHYRTTKSTGMVIFPDMVRWLKVFGFLQCIIAISLVTFLGIPDMAPPHIRATLLYMLLALSQTGTALILIFNPKLMYGMPILAEGRIPKISEKPSVTARDDVKIPQAEIFTNGDNFDVFSRNADRSTLLVKTIETFMDTQKPYLNGRYSITDLSDDLSIPAHHISYILNHNLKMKYSDYINLKRIEHMKTLVASGEMNNFTLESIALRSGFNSRITFIRSVQKLKGMNPSEYFKTALAN